MQNVTYNLRPNYDEVLQQIADYVLNYEVNSDLAFDTARNCLMDTLGCGLLALRFPECTKHLGPIVPGTLVPNGARVPGTSYCLDPVKAAFDIGTIVRWLDYNDTWLAAEWGHPSDNLGAILALSDYLSRTKIANGEKPLLMRDVLTAMIKAHEIQGIFALENSFNQVGLDHVLLVKLASAAVCAGLLGAEREQMLSALSHAFVDGQSLRTYRHAPNAGSRKSWAAGDASSRGLRLADIAMRGEMGIPSVLTAPQWGFYDVSFAHFNKDLTTKTAEERKFSLNQPFTSYVMENVLFKISFPAEFHAQTAVEAAIKLYPQIKSKLNQIDKIVITTHESAIRIISKSGNLNNAADRDHCLQYMTAVGLVFGNLIAEYYEDDFHKFNPVIDEIRSKMQIVENKRYSQEYLDPNKRSIANAVQVFFNDGSSTDNVEVQYPIGHRLRRGEGIPLLENKFKSNLATKFTSFRVNQIFELCTDQNKLEQTPVNKFMDLLVN